MRILLAGGYAKNDNGAIANCEGRLALKRLQPTSHHEGHEEHEGGTKKSKIEEDYE
jgi:hypothetical protein